MRTPNRTFRRPAFTLIEILVALGIIAILVALSAASYFWVVGRQYENNTNATIDHVYNILKKQWNHVIAEAKKESIPDKVRQIAEAPNDPTTSMERAKVIWIMLRLAEAFPQSYAEIKLYGKSSTSPIALLGGTPKYAPTYFSKWNSATGGVTGGDPGIESSACIVLALTTSKGGVSLNLDQLPTKALDWDPKSSTQLADGLVDLCDAWQRPIAFFRYPAANPNLANVNQALLSKAPPLTGPKGVYKNPLDSSKTLIQPWMSATNKSDFENAIRFEIGDWYTTPVLVSGGRDNLLGLEFSNPARGFPDMTLLPMPPVPPRNGDLDNDRIHDAKDNLYSFNIVAP